MKNEYLEINNLALFLNKLKNEFGLKKTIDASREIIDSYILNVDYENSLAFDTSSIVSGDTSDSSSAVLGVGRLGIMALGKS